MNENLHNKNKEFKDLNIEDKILWLSEKYEVPRKLSKEEALKNLRQKISIESTKSNQKTIRWNYYFYAAAAVILLLVGFWFFWPGNQMENIVAAKGQQIDYNLPDGTLVSLNADTKITYDKNKFSKKRNIFLEGEAFFNVEKGGTFTINTNLADIKILGTSFNVFARENQFKVICFTGKILVDYKTQSQIIVPGQTAFIEDETLKVIKEQDINPKADWRIGEFNFENTPLKFVLDEVERQFNVTFVWSNIDDKMFTGSFSNKNLVDALDIICIPMGLTYEIRSNGKILVKNKTD